MQRFASYFDLLDMFFSKSSVTLRNNDHLPVTTTKSMFLSPLLQYKQRPPVNKCQYFGVPREVIVRRFDCNA